MKLKISPFKGLEAAERELKRTELYQDIAKQLKLESYDASPIGHSFVAQYEKQLPGIITAVAGDHSFLNGDDETNRRIIMEAVDSGLALKAGLIAAVLMIIYKIIRVITNNKSFGGGSGGGRGSVPYVTDQQQQLVTAAQELKDSLKEAKEAVAIVKGNAVASDETSPQYAAAEKATSAYRVYVQTGDTVTAQDDKTETANDDPIKVIEGMDLAAIGFGNIPAFMMVSKSEDFLEVVEAVNLVLKALSVYDPAKLSDMVEQISVKLSRPEDAEFLLSQNYNNMINELVSRIGGALGLDKSTNITSLSKLEIQPELKEMYDKMIRTSYGQLMQEKSNEVIGLEEFITDYTNESGEFAKRSMLVAEFNGEFATFLGDNKELEDSRYYSGLQHYATTLSEYKQMIKQSAEVANKDEIIKRLDLLISVIEVYTKFLLATICMFRKEADKVDQFRENNIGKMQKLSKALKDFANSARGETT